MEHVTGDGAYVKFHKGVWPPLCWVWAAKSMPHPIDRGGTQEDGRKATISTNDVINWHGRNKKNCPHCIDPTSLIRKKNSF